MFLNVRNNIVSLFFISFCSQKKKKTPTKLDNSFIIIYILLERVETQT